MEFNILICFLTIFCKNWVNSLKVISILLIRVTILWKRFEISHLPRKLYVLTDVIQGKQREPLLHSSLHVSPEHPIHRMRSGGTQHRILSTTRKLFIPSSRDWINNRCALDARPQQKYTCYSVLYKKVVQ